MCRALISAILLSVPAWLAAQSAPVVQFRYDPPGDGSCAGRAVAPEWDRELSERLPEFRSLWESRATDMIDAVAKLTKKPLTPPGTVGLTLCDIPSNAFFGVTVNMRHALRSYTDSPVPMSYKVHTAFHEMLHSFVARYTPSDSILLAANASESACVRQHLHLLALQKAVLVSLGDLAALEQVVANDSRLPSACYRRAWSIVNASPQAYRGFVAELSR